jgi:hypothetical protein
MVLSLPFSEGSLVEHIKFLPPKSFFCILSLILIVINECIKVDNLSVK